MPRVPGLPIESPLNPAASGPHPTDPANFLLAAADLHSSGEFQASPVPRGKALPGKGTSRSRILQMVK